MEEPRQPASQEPVAHRYQVQLVDWMAWAEGLESREAWQGWATTAQAALPESPSAPAIPFVPSRLRRRMSPLNKMALFVAHHSLARQSLTPDRVIFASQHGELHRTQGLLDAISEQETVSPAHFSLSVHNTSAGLFSIATGCQAPATAIAAGRDTLHFGLLDAIGWLQNRPGDLILFIMADQRLPAAYQSLASTHEEHDVTTFAMALALTAAARPSDVTATAPSEGVWLTATHTPTAQTAQDAGTQASSMVPHAFLRWLLGPANAAPLAWDTQQHSQWQWSRHGRLA